MIGDWSTFDTVTTRKSGVPLYNIEWRDHLGGNTWEKLKNFGGENGVIIVRLFEEERERLAAKHTRTKVRVCFVY